MNFYKIIFKLFRNRHKPPPNSTKPNQQQTHRSNLMTKNKFINRLIACPSRLQYNVNNIDVFIATQKIEMKFKQRIKCEMKETQTNCQCPKGSAGIN